MAPLNNIQIFPIPAFIDNYIWVIAHKISRHAIIVDPGSAEPILNELKNKTLIPKSILITHHHADHIGGIPELLKHYPGLDIIGPKDLRISNVTQTVNENSHLLIEGLTVDILETPGHTKTHICYHIPQLQALFCGDTLFSGGCGRVFEGSHTQMLNSLEKIKHLPLSTKIYCAHEYTKSNLDFARFIEPNNQAISSHLRHLKKLTCSLPSTLKHELLINPFLRTDVQTLRNQVVSQFNIADVPLDIFTTLRNAKDAW